ncbi:MAG TPA: hypothetical protein VGM05_15260 [Planctomycetaceae bacterium]|jgi:hypothetical protein
MSVEFTRWTIHLAMIAYVTVLALRAMSTHRGLDEPRTERLQRVLWSLGCLLTWAHVLLAFGTHHHWSHAAAYDHTASETAKKVGIEWGGGIYFNYLFLALWSADAIWWWIQPASYRARPWGVSLFVHAYLAFIAFNATVVFEAGPIRYAGIGATVGLCTMAVYSRVVSRSR